MALDGCNVLFVFDGLNDVIKCSSIDLLISNLIIGNMLPSAHSCITSRPAAAHQTPNEFIHLVTEARGFSEDQKDFRKRISDQEQANKVISHFKKSKSLHIMCHTLVFCWITATVLQQMLHNIKNDGQEADSEKVPTTLTEIFREEKTLFKSKVFSFVHFSLQEFLAALWVIFMYGTKTKNVLHQIIVEKMTRHNTLCDLHKSAIRNSLESETAHLKSG